MFLVFGGGVILNYLLDNLNFVSQKITLDYMGEGGGPEVIE